MKQILNLGVMSVMSWVAGAGLALFPAAQAVTSIQVDLELALVIDVSGSVDSTEYALQRTGYANAFRNPQTHAAIGSGSLGMIAVSAIQFDQSSYLSIPWTLISSSADAIAFADLLDNMVRAGSGSTGVGQAIVFAANSMFGNEYDGARLVIDVSGDGENNSGIDAATARDQALAGGVTTINAIAIGDPSGTLRTYYETEVIGGTNAFARNADTFADFEAEILDKLVAEISGQSTYPILVTLHSAAVATSHAATRDVAGRLIAIRAGVPQAMEAPAPAPAPSAKGGMSGKEVYAAPAPVTRQWEVFGTLFYIEQDTDAQTALIQTRPVLLFPGTDVEILGGSVGIERRFSPEWVAGLAFSATNSDVTVQNFSTADIDGYYLTPYVSYYRSDAFGGMDFYADLLYSYGQQDYDIQRGTASGSTDGNTHALEFTTGLNFRSGNVRHGPFLGLHWLTGDIDAYAETGPGAMAVAGTDFDSLASHLGYQASIHVPVNSGTLVPFARVAWVHEYEDDAVVIGGTPVSVVDEDSVVAGIGIGAWLNNGWNFRTEYEGRFGSDTTRHYVGLRVGYEF